MKKIVQGPNYIGYNSIIYYDVWISDICHNHIIWSLYCEPAPLLTLQPQATTPSIYLHTHAVLALAVGFQTFSPSPTYIPEFTCTSK